MSEEKKSRVDRVISIHLGELDEDQKQELQAIRDWYRRQRTEIFIEYVNRVTAFIKKHKKVN